MPAVRPGAVRSARRAGRPPRSADRDGHGVLRSCGRAGPARARPTHRALKIAEDTLDSSITRLRQEPGKQGGRRSATAWKTANRVRTDRG